MSHQSPITSHQSLEKGQSLVEVIIALAVAVIVIIALVRVVVTSIHNASFARNQALATKYAQEGLEKLRAYRDQNTWQNFTINCTSTLRSVSLPSLFVLSADTGCNCGGDSCEIKIAVSWRDAAGLHKSELTTRLTKWK